MDVHVAMVSYEMVDVHPVVVVQTWATVIFLLAGSASGLARENVHVMAHSNVHAIRANSWLFHEHLSIVRFAPLHDWDQVRDISDLRRSICLGHPISADI